MTARQTIFQGRVQGVGFRYTCRELSKGFDLTGTVENLPDDSVRLVLQGDFDEIEEFLDELIDKSALSHLIKSHLTLPIEPDPALKGFAILR